MHEQLINLYGGSHGVRDETLLESALEMPRSGFGGEYFHTSLFAMAAAYLFHITKNHPFIDGNKRIGFACAHTFLQLNGYALTSTPDNLYALVLRVAAGEIQEKEEIAQFLETHSQPEQQKSGF